MTSQQRYLPFGQVRTDVASPNSQSLITDYGYTGQRNLDESIGLMDYRARFYSPVLNRFIQPDTIVPGMYNPQNLNRFSYVRNNPIRYTDPSGHISCSHGNLPEGECGDIGLSTRGQQLVDFAESMGMTPEEVIGIGLGHEMFGDNENEQKIHMDAFRNGFLGYANDASSHCNGNLTYNCMLNYFSSAYESVYNQFLDNGVPATFWETRKDYIFDQAYGNLGDGNKAAVQLGKEFMLGNGSTGSFMETISSYSFDPNLAVSSGVVDAQALIKYLHGYPTSGQGFLVVKRVTCPYTGAAGFTLYYNMSGMQTLTDAGLGVC